MRIFFKTLKKVAFSNEYGYVWTGPRFFSLPKFYKHFAPSDPPHVNTQIPQITTAQWEHKRCRVVCLGTNRKNVIYIVSSSHLFNGHASF